MVCSYVYRTVFSIEKTTGVGVEALFTSALGSKSPWVVKKVKLETANRRIDFEIGCPGSRLLQQVQRNHQQALRSSNGQALYGLTELMPAQKSLFTVL